MGTIIKYTNSDYQPITEQQKELLKFYNKQFFVNNDLKKIEMYGTQGRTNDIILKGGEYYLAQGEELHSIISQYISIGSHWIFYYDKQTNAFGDIYWEYVLYENQVLKRKGRHVFNIEGLLIASCTIDLITNEIEDRKKYFYGDINFYKRLSYKDIFLNVSYNDNEVEQIYIFDENYDLAEFLSSPDAIKFDWNSHTYYHDFVPMLPTGLIV